MVLFRERPISRLLAVEALGALPISALTLPASSPAHSAVPEWVQLLGLMTLLMLYGTALSTWRLIVADRLRPAPKTRQHLRDDRRVRLLVLGGPPAMVILLSVPSAWTAFWFTLTLTTLAGGAASLIRLAAMLSGRSPGKTTIDHPGHATTCPAHLTTDRPS
ncbi:hypothetical protein GCM10010156_23730 [Planobispora rosea]|uniref:Uncharacterized protein n=2 Tax=Planobispora rosea TaxID=35762 RepID=A0A8J3S2C1_PLARO|nr:hypothetical protein GCM10010156_23730 [Planobispora rosea]GIH84537.1 hypothetical protein Pro02_29450 [Planobispora rosea]